MTLLQYYRIILSHWALVLFSVLMGLSLGGIYSAYSPKTYVARSQVYVTLEGAQSLADLKAGAEYLDSSMSSWASVAGSEVALRPVINNLRLERSVDELMRDTTIVREPSTYTLSISISDRDPNVASAIANGVAAQLDATLPGLARVPSSDSSFLRVRQIVTSTPPEQPTTPNVRMAVPAGVVGGFAVGLTLAVLRSRDHGSAS